MKNIEITVTGSPTAARDLVVSYLEGHNFRVKSVSEWELVAETGSKVKQMFLGAFAKYLKFGVSVFSQPDGSTTVRLAKVASGAMGGLIGVAKANRALTGAGNDISLFFSEQGLLLSTTEN